MEFEYIDTGQALEIERHDSVSARTGVYPRPVASRTRNGPGPKLMTTVGPKHLTKLTWTPAVPPPPCGRSQTAALVLAFRSDDAGVHGTQLEKLIATVEVLLLEGLLLANPANS
jgi:hypothetical protein